MKQENLKKVNELADHLKSLHDGLKLKVNEVEKLKVIVETKDNELKAY